MMNLASQTLCFGRILSGSVIFVFLIIHNLLIVRGVSIHRIYLRGLS